MVGKVKVAGKEKASITIFFAISLELTYTLIKGTVIVFKVVLQFQLFSFGTILRYDHALGVAYSQILVYLDLST